MKVLHTSDWHLGRSLYNKKRDSEFQAFLDWLAHTIEQQGVDLLLVAGDIFDTCTPSNRAQQLYYSFLCRIAASPCRHVVVIAGNHDSPTFLEAPKALLQSLNVHVVGATTGRLEDEVVVLYRGAVPEAIVCAVPYLRDRDLRAMEPGENRDDTNAKLLAGLKQHYAKVCALAEATRRRLAAADYLPLIGMGHLFAAGSVTLDDDGVRELYVGSLARVRADIFPPCLDYVALGHLHVPQRVGGYQHIRYCGSPLPMGFGEAEQQKCVVLAAFTGQQLAIQTLAIPCFQRLLRISGDLDAIQRQISALKQQGSNGWLEIIFTGKTLVADLRASLEEAVSNSELEVLRVKNCRVIEALTEPAAAPKSLDELSPNEVFARCLDANGIDGDERDQLKNCYAEVIQALQLHDANAE